MLTTRELTQSEFEDSREEWNNLLSKSSADNVFLTWEWLYCWWHEFGQNKELCLVAVRKNNRLIGIGPFYLERPIPFLKWRVLKICGSDDLGPDYLDIIAPKEEEKAVYDAIFDYLFRKKKQLVLASLNHVLEQSSLSSHIQRQHKNMLVNIRAASVCPYLKITGSFDEYLNSQFNGKKRWFLRRKIKRAIKEKQLSFFNVSSNKDVSKRLDELFELHAMRFTAKKQNSTFCSQKTKRFLNEFSRLALDKGILDFYGLQSEKRAVSVLYGLRYKNKHYYYQSGIHTDWSRYSVGSVLLNLVIQKCFADGLAEFDFLKGTEKYKASWMNRQRAEQHIFLYKKSPIGYALFTITRFYHRIKRMLKGFSSVAAKQGVRL